MGLYIRNICGSPNTWRIFQWGQNSVWAHVGIFVSGLMKLRLEYLYLNSYFRGL